VSDLTRTRRKFPSDGLSKDIPYQSGKADIDTVAVGRYLLGEDIELTRAELFYAAAETCRSEAYQAEVRERLTPENWQKIRNILNNRARNARQ
jgi:hypothetical protein